MFDRPGSTLGRLYGIFQYGCSLGIGAVTIDVWRTRILVVLAALVVLAGGPVHAEGERVALVMAGESYTPLPRSAVKASSATRIAEALRRQGFTVTVAADPSNAVARARLTEFAHAAEGAHAAVVVLAGHGVTTGGRTFFLPVNAEIKRETDLLTRAVAVGSVAQIAAKARVGAVLFAMTVPELPASLQGIDARPNISGEVAANVVVAFSTSEKMPVSRADKAAEEAMRDLATVAGEKPLRLLGLVNALAAGGSGKVFGRVADMDLSTAPAKAAPVPAAVASEEAKARREAEERARRAEEREREAEARARQAEQSKEQSATPPADSTAALQTVESLFGRAQRKAIQGKLQKLGHYKGPIDAVFAELTRAAIKDYQAAANAPATGYLTPEQVQQLLKE